MKDEKHECIDRIKWSVMVDSLEINLKNEKYVFRRRGEWIKDEPREEWIGVKYLRYNLSVLGSNIKNDYNVK